MEYKYVNLFLLFIVVVLIAMNYNLAPKHESFINNSERHNENIRQALAEQEQNKTEAENEDVLKTNLDEGTNYVKDSETLQDMFKAVSNSEALCDEIENNQKNRNMLEQYKINESTLRELSDQKKRINELRKTVNYLRKEKLKRQTVSDKCRIDSQKKLNKDYKLVQKLAEQNLLTDDSVKVELNVADSLKNLKRKKANNLNNSVNNNKGNVNVANNNSKSHSQVPRYANKRCPSVSNENLIHKDEARGLCHNCDVDSLSENYPYLMKDFS